MESSSHTSFDSDTIIHCESLSKVYGEFVAVDSLDLNVKRGRVLGLVGPNGAGKTTSMRCLAGIIPASGGNILINGKTMSVDTVAAKGDLCFVPDTPHLFDYLTVEEHLRFAGRIHQLADIDQRIASLLDQFELSDKANNLPDALSRGMKQKVAICLGFLHDPAAIFLDEPLTGLDPLGIRRMKDAIVQRAKQQSAAVIVSSHQLELIEAICDEIFIIKDGRKVVCGTLDELHDHVGAERGALSLEDLFFRLTGVAEEPLETSA